MKQILQNLGSGETLLAEVPAPGVRAGTLFPEFRGSAEWLSCGVKNLERQIRLDPVSPEKRERIRALAETRISATAAAKFLREEILTDAK